MTRSARFGSLLLALLCLTLAGCVWPDANKAVQRQQGAGQGALFGAYVAPESYTDAGRVEALERFEAELGRPLGVVHSYHRWERPFPSDFDRYVVTRRNGTLLLSWGGTDTDDIVAGVHDTMIRERARAVRDLGVPILLRWRWEMNRPNLREQMGSPEAYVAAWRHLRRLFEQEGADQVSWVWCPIAHDFDATRGPEYYPGDDEVDWICADAYSRSVEEPLAHRLEEFLDWAQSRPHPIMIGEFSVPRVPGADMAGWLEEAQAFVRSHEQIAAAVFYESDNAEAARYAAGPDPAAFRALRAWADDPWFEPDWDVSSPPGMQ